MASKEITPMHRIFFLLTLLLSGGAASAQEQSPYQDDRSTPEAVVSSYYDAVNRGEYARAYSYFGSADAPAYQAWEAGYHDTGTVEVRFGKAESEGAAGSTYYTLPVALDAAAKNGLEHRYFTGCYTLRLVQPAVQTPPFQGMHIVDAKLKEAPEPASPAASCEP